MTLYIGWHGGFPSIQSLKSLSRSITAFWLCAPQQEDQAQRVIFNKHDPRLDA
jgi:hypothetical protein